MNSSGSSFQFKVVRILCPPRNHKSLTHIIWSSDVDVIVANYNHVTCLLAGSPIARYLTTFCPYIRARPCSVQLTSPTLLLSSWMSQQECRVVSERLLTARHSLEASPGAYRRHNPIGFFRWAFKMGFGL